MKRRCSILLLLAGLMLMAGCHDAAGTDGFVSLNPPAPLKGGHAKRQPEAKVAEPGRSVEGPTESLCTVDSLMWRQPDSAFALLVDFAGSPQADSLDAFNGHYFHLLLSELLYKNDYAQSNRPELRQAVAYFDSLTLSVNDKRRPPRPHRGLNPRSQNLNDFLFFLDARSHYINGVGYYENDSVVEACGEYLKTLETMEENFEEKVLKGNLAMFMVLTYVHLTSLFSDQYLHEQAIYFGRLCLSYYQKYEANSWHMGWVLNEIGSNYDMMEQLDSADYYYSKAIDILNDTSSLLYRDVVAHQTLLKYKKDNQLTNEAVNSLLHSLSKSESDQETISRYSYIGEILYHENQLDSAWMFLSLVFQESANIGLKKQAAERLVEICKAQNKSDSILEYAGFLVPFANQEENRSEIKSQLTELYKTFIQERLERQHNKETKNHIKRTMVIVAGLFFAILTVSLFYHRNKQHKRDLETLIEKERHAHKMQQAALAGRLKQSNAALKEKENTIKPVDSNVFAHQQRSDVEHYEEEPICQYIIDVCNDKKNPIKTTVPVSAYANIALNDAQKAQLKKAATLHYGSFFERLKQEHPELKEKDFQYCYLSLLGLDNARIAVLLQLSVSTVWDRENRLKRIFGSENRVAIILYELMIH